MQIALLPNLPSEEADEISCHSAVVSTEAVVPLDRFSSSMRFKRVMSWMMRFLHNCRARRRYLSVRTGPLTVDELDVTASYWISLSQGAHFSKDFGTLKAKASIPRSSALRSLNPFLDEQGLLRVGGRQENSELAYSRHHPIIIHGKYPVSKLLFRSEHLRLLHAGPLLVSASLGRHYHVVGGHRAIRSSTRSCVICRRKSVRPRSPVMGQLPFERVTADLVFSRVGVDQTWSHSQAYCRKGLHCSVCLPVSEVVHIELVSDLTSEAFIACLRRFIARRGKPTLIWSDHGTNFLGATRLLKELLDFLQQQKSREAISNFCSS